MNHEQNKPSKWKKRLAQLALGSAIIAGTYFGRYRDLPPFYSYKVGTSGGVCVSVYTHIDKNAVFYGPMISLASTNEGTINGARISLFNGSNGGKTNGLEIGLLNIGKEKEGKTRSSILNGLQIGLGNEMREGSHGVQVGIINNEQGEEKSRTGVILNTSPLKRNQYRPATQPSTQPAKETK